LNNLLHLLNLLCYAGPDEIVDALGKAVFRLAAQGLLRCKPLLDAFNPLTTRL
jgi:hypothetical protein